MWKLDHKEGWELKYWCFWTMVLGSKEIKPKWNQSWIFIGILSKLMSKLKFQYTGHLKWRVNSLEKTLVLRNIEARWRRGSQRMRWLDGVTDPMDLSWANSSSWWRTGSMACCIPSGCKESDMTEQLNSNYRGINELFFFFFWCSD